MSTTANTRAMQISGTARTFAFPCSYAQSRLWFLDQLDPGNPIYNVQMGLRLDGELDAKALQLSLSDIVKRHEVLRTTFSYIDSRPMQIVHDQSAFELKQMDLSSIDESVRQSQLDQLMRQEGEKGFDLESGPLLRGHLLRMAPYQHVLLIVMHHIVGDAWSKEVLLYELKEFYEAHRAGRTPRLEDLAIQYADYAIWQRDWLAGELLETQLAYWKEQLADIEPIPLSTDRPRPSVAGKSGAREHFFLPPDLTKKLKQLSRSHGATLFMTLLAGFKVLLWRYSGQEDIAIGTPVAGRDAKELEKLVGFFVNTLVMRIFVDGNLTVSDLLNRVRTTALGAYDHQDIPFEKLVDELAPARNLSHSPLFQVLFSFQNASRTTVRFPGLSLEKIPFETPSAKFDLDLFLEEKEERLAGRMQYRTELYNRSTVQRVLGHYKRALEQMVQWPEKRLSELTLLTEEERRQMVEGWNETWMKYPEGRTLHGLFGEQARRTPEAVAVLFRGKEIKYEELERRSNQLAHYLRRQGVGVEARVGICLTRSPEMVMAVLGVLKAGGAYVPLDPGYPEERLRYMVEDAETRVVLTEEGVRGRLGESRGRVICLEQEWEQIGRESEEGVEGGECERGNLAYVIYTSGSTGKPKGVGITHGSAVTLMYWGRDVVPERWLKGVLAATSICFDLSVFELFVPLSWGGRVVLVENVLELGEEGSQSWSGEVMLVNTVPSAMRELLQMKAVPKRVRGVLLAGEALLPGLVEQIYELEHVEQVWNLYGPSEDTTYSVYQRVERGSRRVAIGRPIANTRAYVLDGEMEAVPVGVGGELYLGGEGLGRGYLKRAGLTGERFVPDGISGGEGERLYRTGDRVRWVEDGRLEFLGRSDHQVKLRGFRIELGEIETVLESHAGLHHSAIVVREDKPGEQKLVAYVVRSQKMNLLDAVELKSHLRTKLPEYMLPAAFIELPELPLSPNGKVDRQALASMNGHGLPTQRDLKIDIRDCPRNTFELYVITIFEDVLGIKGLTSKHNFFELGGHSLSALMLADRLSQAFKKPISVRNVFEHPTIEAMAAFARQELAFSPPSCLIPIKPHGSLPPLFLVHPGGGRVMGYLPLGRTLSQDRPLYALQSYGLEEGQNVLFTVEDMAAAYIKEVRNVQPTGPYQIGGWCLGGTLAYEMAQQLRNAGETVSLLAILEDFAYSSPTRRPITEEELQQEKKIHLQKIMAQYFPPKFRISGSQLPHEFSLSYEEQLELILQKLKEAGQVPKDESCDRYRRAFHVTSVNIAAKRRYHLRPYTGHITLFRCKHSWHPDPTYGWGRLGASLDVHQFDWPHDDFISERPQELAETLERCMDKSLFEMRASASVYRS